MGMPLYREGHVPIHVHRAVHVHIGAFMCPYVPKCLSQNAHTISNLQNACFYMRMIHK